MSKQTNTFPDLRTIRKDRGATLEQFAEELGIAVSQLSNIERGFFTRLSLEVALRVSKLYRVPVERLVKAA